ncbi:hypothetical protein [Mongoliibacter ruber]|uniref:Uncharacterized protein n=1 Tax=Mongoliibacter ruber TaxID=1750599 RepID=A0A2T0WGR2_9BACT|nr:hypothetical protein [Mongoliibacter ruber]PRY85898.1 hypothetical protein CLW00_11028 [Mongoliibacter ruber]
MTKRKMIYGHCLRHPARIYFIIGFFYGLSLINPVFAQIALQIGDFRTIGTGDFDNPAIWETWDGLAWQAATVKPGMMNTIFVDQGHEVRLTADEEVNHVYLYSAALPGRKLNLQTFELHVYGSLRGMHKPTGDFEINNLANASIDWIYPQSGKIVFKGNSRIVVDRSSWSAQTNNSRYQVVFDALPGETLTVNSAFKANVFVVNSGTVLQTVNNEGIPACSTFSFNNQVAFNGSGPYGNLIIEPNATLISECSAPLDQLVRRSVSIPAALIHLKPGGNLVFLGNEPIMESADFQLEGNVYYRSNAGTQVLVSSTMAAAIQPKKYHNLIFENNAQKLLIDSLFLSGDLARLSGGDIVDAPSYLNFQGDAVQQVVGLNFDFTQVEINKSGGRLVMDSDMRIKTNFFHRNGQIDFNGFDLYFNTDGAGVYEYEGGQWLNLNRMTYNFLPTVLNVGNASFPFEDAYQGGVRRLRLNGNSPGGNLSLRFFEIPGANWDPNFDDVDGSPILYQLNSYFEFSGLSASSDPIELRIAAENLIVDEVDDIRIVGNGLAAPGVHLPGVDADTLWARRSLEFAELDGNTFTIGSYRQMSILPLTWVGVEAKMEKGEIVVRWSTAQEKGNEKFILYRAKDKRLEFEKIAEIPSRGDREGIQEYNYRYIEKLHEAPYFQLEQVEIDGKSSFSEVFRLGGEIESFTSPTKVFPNPYVSGKINFVLPPNLGSEDVMISVFGISGEQHFSLGLESPDLEEKFSRLPKGIFVIQLEAPGFQDRLKFWKR